MSLPSANYPINISYLMYFIPYLGQSINREGNVNKIITISAVNSTETYAHT